jgi:hypothetical protein
LRKAFEKAGFRPLSPSKSKAAFPRLEFWERLPLHSYIPTARESASCADMDVKYVCLGLPTPFEPFLCFRLRALMLRSRRIAANR